MLLSNEWINTEIKEQIKQKQYLETNENEYTTQNLWDTVKTVRRGKFVTIQAYLKKIEKSPFFLHDNIFTNTSSRARDIKERVKKWDYIKLKIFCRNKENINKIEMEPTICENIFANDTSEKGLICRIYKELT